MYDAQFPLLAAIWKCMRGSTSDLQMPVRNMMRISMTLLQVIEGNQNQLILYLQPTMRGYTCYPVSGPILCGFGLRIFFSIRQSWVTIPKCVLNNADYALFDSNSQKLKGSVSSFHLCPRHSMWSRSWKWHYCLAYQMRLTLPSMWLCCCLVRAAIPCRWPRALTWLNSCWHMWLSSSMVSFHTDAASTIAFAYYCSLSEPRNVLVISPDTVDLHFIKIHGIVDVASMNWGIQGIKGVNNLLHSGQLNPVPEWIYGLPLNADQATMPFGQFHQAPARCQSWPNSI